VLSRFTAMEILTDALIEALRLLAGLDPALLEIAGLTLRVTAAGLFLAVLLGVPVGAALGLSGKIPAAGCILPLIYTGMGLPPVVVGLAVYLVLSNQGPLGELGGLFTPGAMVFAQTVIALPLVVGLTLSAVQSLDPDLPRQVRSLGATRRQLVWTMLVEARFGLFAAIVAAFGSIISEVGAVMLVGGNIAGETRVLTTAIVLETRRGNFSLALALGIILLGLAFAANWAFYRLQVRR
ncbi:MAG TPA: ABC transporter permease, partial [Anaerolineales bacterium]|nr:ABC transporter permease [Anaerolineales bacterium]